MSAGAPATTRAELAKIWLIALALVGTLVAVREVLAKPPTALFTSAVPVSVRSAPHGGGADLSAHYLYTDEFEVTEGSSIELAATRTAADGILAIEVDLVPESGPATFGAALFASQRMSVHGLRGDRSVHGVIRGAEPGRYRLRLAGSWVPQPREGRIPQATLRSSTQAGSPAGFTWALLLLLLPAVVATARRLLAVAPTSSAATDPPSTPALESNTTQMPVQTSTI